MNLQIFRYFFVCSSAYSNSLKPIKTYQVRILCCSLNAIYWHYSSASSNPKTLSKYSGTQYARVRSSFAKTCIDLGLDFELK